MKVGVFVGEGAPFDRLRVSGVWNGNTHLLGPSEPLFSVACHWVRARESETEGGVVSNGFYTSSEIVVWVGAGGIGAVDDGLRVG